jgi:hypothetical protein
MDFSCPVVSEGRNFQKFSAKPGSDLQWVMGEENFLNLRQNGSLLTKCQL